MMTGKKTIVIGGRTFKDYSGQKWGKLRAISIADIPRVNGKTIWTFECECGQRTTIPVHRVIDGITRSCGCNLEQWKESFGDNYGGEKGKSQNPSQKISQDTIDRIQKLHQQGMFQKDIATELGVSIGTVNKYVHQRKRLTSLVEQANNPKTPKPQNPFVSELY